MTTSTRRTPAARPRYRARTVLVFPTHEKDRARRLAGERCIVTEWTKILPGELVPDFLVECSPGIVAKGRVELVEDGD